MLSYIDIHTHQQQTDRTIFSIFNQIIGQDEKINTICSAGIHPWYIDKDIESQMATLKSNLQKSNVIALGECGLDKICDTDWAIQVKVFENQIQLANEFKKPLIIHCVRAYEEVIQTLKNQKAEVPVLFHGVNKKHSLIQSLINQGYHISLGAFILNGQHDETIENIDLAKFFLETDNKSTNIVDIYSYFCCVRNISTEQLQQQLVQNLSNVFNYDLVLQ